MGLGAAAVRAAELLEEKKAKDREDLEKAERTRVARGIEVSICMCSYRRAALLRKTLESIKRQKFGSYEVVVCEDGDDGGWTRGVCEDYGVIYFQRKHRPEQIYSNPAIPWNVALRNSVGETIILQNPECEHISEDVIERLAKPHRPLGIGGAAPVENVAVFASVAALNVDGNFDQWYCHPEYSARPLFFCGSLSRKMVFKLRGFDEDYGRGTGGYGYDDDDFAFRLQVEQVRFDFRPESEILVHHLWHDRPGCYGLASNEALFSKKLMEMTSGKIGVARNLDHEWGVLTE